MLAAICFKCGEPKRQPFDVCEKCGATPTSASARTMSLAMSTHIASEAQLAQYKDEIARGVKPSIPMGALSKAIEGVKNGLRTARSATSAPIEGAEGDSTTPGQAHNPTNSGTAEPGSDSGWDWKPFGTSIDDVPFAALGATPRDTRKRIFELTEERSLKLDPMVCQKAYSELTNPRKRLSAELAWFPGLSPGKVVKCLGALHYDPMFTRKEAGLPLLARFNLMTYALEMVKDHSSTGDIATFLCEATKLAEDIELDSVLRDINEDRGVAKFPPLQSADQVEAALGEHKENCREIMKRALNKLPSSILVHVLTEAIDTATDSGETPAPKLLDDLVDSYAAEVQTTLDTGAVHIRKLIEAVKASVGSGAAVVDSKIVRLEVATKKWDAIAQPIQLSAKARGTDHELSRGLAGEIRNLAIDLFNNHDLLTQAQRITRLLQEVFAELPEVVERVDNDASDLDEIAKRRSVEHALDPIRSRCEQACKYADENAAGAYLEAHILLKDGPKLLKEASVEAGSRAYRDAEDMLAGACMHCAVAYGNKTSTWEPCVTLLERALGLANDTTLRQRISENLATAKSNHANLGDCEPINKAPELHTINGIGFTLYGNTDPKPNGSHMATYYFVFFGIPIFPIRRYRVIPTPGGYRFLGKAKLRSFDKWHMGVILALIGWAVLAGMA